MSYCEDGSRQLRAGKVHQAGTGLIMEEEAEEGERGDPVDLYDFD